MLSSAPSISTNYRLAGLNLLAAIIIYRNTRKLGEAVFTRKNAGLDVPSEGRIPDFPERCSV